MIGEETRNFFLKNRFLALGDLLTAEECQAAVNKMFKKYENGDPVSRDRCTKSVAYHGVFDDILFKLWPVYEKALGLKLYPSYSYARIYFPGEQLRVHVDKEQCEYNITMTLGYKGGSIWPFYVAEAEKENSVVNENGETITTVALKNQRKIIVPVGACIIYKGKEVYHWRDEYKEGDWQVQMFLHYVDVNGKFAHLKHEKTETYYAN